MDKTTCYWVFGLATGIVFMGLLFAIFNHNQYEIGYAEGFSESDKFCNDYSYKMYRECLDWCGEFKVDLNYTNWLTCYDFCDDI